MVKKALSLATAAAIVYVYLQSQLQSGDALFLVTSDNLAVNAVLVAMAAAGVYLSFMDKFSSWQTYAAAAAGSILLGFIGLIGLAYVSIDNYFAGIIKPLDYVIILQLGIIYGICTLSYEHQPVKLAIPRYDRTLRLMFMHRLNSAMSKPVVAASRPRRQKPRPA